jgi:methylene-tetrahydrofolate reductase-like protein
MNIGAWFRNRPRFLECSYHFVLKLMKLLKYFGGSHKFHVLEKIILPPEKLSKKILFDCSMCGQCVLQSTGMTCPMTCPKNIRNGPCGGVRQNGNCEVFEDIKCIWVEAHERNNRMNIYADQIHQLQIPLNNQLRGISSWINLMEEEAS